MSIASRADLKEYILRRLGKPVIQINVADEQVEDRISDAFQIYGDYHFDASSKDYLKHKVTQQDKQNKYIPIPEQVIGVNRIFPIYDVISSENMFDVRYQMALNDFFDFSAVELSHYHHVRTHLSTIREMLHGMTPIRFSRHMNRLYIDMNWDAGIGVGEYLIVECIKVLDADEFTEVYNDRWLKEYCTALTKMQWGQNLSKYQGIQLPGGNTLDGARLISEAQEEIRRLEDDLSLRYELPVDFYLG